MVYIEKEIMKQSCFTLEKKLWSNHIYGIRGKLKEGNIIERLRKERSSARSKE